MYGLLFPPALTLVLGNQFVPNTLTVLFLWPSASVKRARIARHLVKSILYGIWVFRNKATFYNVSYDHRLLLNLLWEIFDRKFELTF